MVAPFSTITADPPWPYANPGHFTLNHGSLGASARRHYPLMALDDLCALPVRAIAADDAHLHLWVTNGFVEQGHRLARAWGFRPITLCTWVKTTKDGRVYRGGMGRYFRNTTEHWLFCVRGRLRFPDGLVAPTAYLWGREPHSRKPDAFYRLVETCSPGPHLELFSRERRGPKWSVWGNQVADSIDLHECAQSASTRDEGSVA